MVLSHNREVFPGPEDKGKFNLPTMSRSRRLIHVVIPSPASRGMQQMNYVRKNGAYRHVATNMPMLTVAAVSTRWVTRATAIYRPFSISHTITAVAGYGVDGVGGELDTAGYPTVL
jgi:hypothetical protein